MCGITAVFSKNENIFQDLYESLYHLQHRGQDTFGFSYLNDNNIELIKENGLLSNHNFDSINTNVGIGHVRYPTTGQNTINECQPLFLKGKYHNISLVHNGQINKEKLLNYFHENNILLNSSATSDSILLLHFLSHLLNKYEIINDDIIKNIIHSFHTDFNTYIHGSYNCICLINTYGLVCFKDKYSIRPLIYGKKDNNYIITSESIAITSINYEIVSDLYSSDIIIFNRDSFRNIKLPTNTFKPCIFEWIYLAREESIIYNVNVNQARMKMGEYLAHNIQQSIDTDLIDCIVPIPDTSKPVALEISKHLNIPYYEAITKNRYVNRTFIMDSQLKRKKNIKRKKKNETFKN